MMKCSTHTQKKKTVIAADNTHILTSTALQLSSSWLTMPWILSLLPTITATPSDNSVCTHNHININWSIIVKIKYRGAGREKQKDRFKAVSLSVFRRQIWVEQLHRTDDSQRLYIVNKWEQSRSHSIHWSSHPDAPRTSTHRSSVLVQAYYCWQRDFK